MNFLSHERFYGIGNVYFDFIHILQFVLELALLERSKLGVGVGGHDILIIVQYIKNVAMLSRKSKSKLNSNYLALATYSNNKIKK